MPTTAPTIAQSSLTTWVYNKRYPFPLPTHAELLKIFPENVWLMIDFAANEYMIVRAGTASDAAQRAARISGWQDAGYSPVQVSAKSASGFRDDGVSLLAEESRALQAQSRTNAEARDVLASGAVCGWCTEVIDGSRMLLVRDNSSHQAALRTTIRAGTLLPMSPNSDEGGARFGDYAIRCRTASGWSEEVMPAAALERLQDCRPLYVVGSQYDINRFARDEIDPRVTSPCELRTLWRRDLIESLSWLGSSVSLDAFGAGPRMPVVEFVSLRKRDGSPDGRAFDSVELKCSGSWCEVWVPYIDCNADPYHFKPWWLMGVSR